MDFVYVAGAESPLHQGEQLIQEFCRTLPGREFCALRPGGRRRGAGGGGCSRAKRPRFAQCCVESRRRLSRGRFRCGAGCGSKDMCAAWPHYSRWRSVNSRSGHSADVSGRGQIRVCSEVSSGCCPKSARPLTGCPGFRKAVSGFRSEVTGHVIADFGIRRIHKSLDLWIKEKPRHKICASGPASDYLRIGITRRASAHYPISARASFLATVSGTP